MQFSKSHTQVKHFMIRDTHTHTEQIDVKKNVL